MSARPHSPINDLFKQMDDAAFLRCMRAAWEAVHHEILYRSADEEEYGAYLAMRGCLQSLGVECSVIASVFYPSSNQPCLGIVYALCIGERVINDASQMGLTHIQKRQVSEWENGIMGGYWENGYVNDPYWEMAGKSFIDRTMSWIAERRRSLTQFHQNDALMATIEAAILKEASVQPCARSHTSMRL